MLTWQRFLIFLTIVLSIMGGVHGYLFSRLVRGTALPTPWSTVAGLALVAAVLCIPLSFMASRALDKNLARWLVVPVFVWLGFAFLTFFAVLFLDILRGLSWISHQILGGEPPLMDPAGRLSSWRVTAGSAVGATFLATAFSTWWALTRLAVKRIEVVLPNLPEDFDGFSIAHLSDLHLDLVHGEEWLASVVEKTNTLKPDLVAITGDLAEGSVRQFGKETAPLKRLQAPHGTYFVTGNHEYFHDLEGWMGFLPELGIRVLRNEGLTLDAGGRGFFLAGVDDHDGARLAPDHGPDVAKALRGRNPGDPVVLLAHQPRIMDEAVRHGVDLVLSGHTHGGQIWPFSYLVYLQQPYVRGLKERDGTRLYLSSGTGFWGPPMRLGTTAEIALITLRSPPSP
jgi:predicted MPP superfamily phosphohydrolase